MYPPFCVYPNSTLPVVLSRQDKEGILHSILPYPSKFLLDTCMTQINTQSLKMVLAWGQRFSTKLFTIESVRLGGCRTTALLNKRSKWFAKSIMWNVLNNNIRSTSFKFLSVSPCVFYVYAPFIFSLLNFFFSFFFLPSSSSYWTTMVSNRSNEAGSLAFLCPPPFFAFLFLLSLLSLQY